MSEELDVEARVSSPASLDEALGDPNDLMNEIASELDGTSPDDAITPMVLDELEENEAPLSMRDVRLLSDIDVDVTVEFGRARLALRDLLSLRRGSLVELSRGLDQPVTILANDTLVAYGEVVMVGDHFGVHVLEIVDPDNADRPRRTERSSSGQVDPQALRSPQAPAPTPHEAPSSEPADTEDPGPDTTDATGTTE